MRPDEEESMKLGALALGAAAAGASAYGAGIVHDLPEMMTPDLRRGAAFARQLAAEKAGKGRRDHFGLQRTRGTLALNAKRTVLQAFRRWRDPDSNRGHHDFQTGVRNTRTRAERPATARVP
jgi:hypothetical protein